MRNDRVSSTPGEPSRCPVCLGDLDRRGVCRECGRSFAPPTPFAVPALRRLTYGYGRPWYDNLFYFGFGILFLLPVVIFAFDAPGVLVPFGVLLLPAVIRTVRLMLYVAEEESRSIYGHFFGALVASFGVAALAAIPSAVALCCVCVGLPGGNSISAPPYITYTALGAAGVVFVVVFVLLWPRSRSGESARPPHDPEN
jgi:hypothetical protein